MENVERLVPTQDYHEKKSDGNSVTDVHLQ